MDPDAWKRLESVFFEAIELEPDARHEFLWTVPVVTMRTSGRK